MKNYSTIYLRTIKVIKDSWTISRNLCKYISVKHMDKSIYI